jgi:hypothetical protein
MTMLLNQVITGWTRHTDANETRGVLRPGHTASVTPAPQETASRVVVS